MNKTDLFTLLRLGPLEDGDVVIRYQNNYTVVKMTELQYTHYAGELPTVSIQGVVVSE